MARIRTIKPEFWTNERVQQWTAKLTDDAVVEIRRLAGSVSQKDLAARFGVCKSTIGFVVKNQTWKHI